MAQPDIESALNVILADNPLYPVSFENNQTDQSGTYYEQSFLPTEKSNISVAFDGARELTGTYQILIKVLLNTGKAESDAGANELETKFKRGVQLSFNGQTAETESVYIEDGFPFENYWIVPCNVRYKGFEYG